MVNDTAAFSLFRRFAETLVNGYDLNHVLSELAGELRDILDVAGAGVMLADDEGDLRFVSSSDDTLKRLEDLQIELQEGPCLRAYRTASPVMATDLRDDPEFPAFGPRAVQAGMLAVFSYPLKHGTQVFGALNLYRGTPGPLDPRQRDLGAVFSEIATLYLTHGSDDERRDLVTRQLQSALDSRIVIEQAKGYVAATRGTDVSSAFESLRTYARSNGHKLHDVARQVVERTLTVDELERRSAQ